MPDQPRVLFIDYPTRFDHPAFPLRFVGDLVAGRYTREGLSILEREAVVTAIRCDDLDLEGKFAGEICRSDALVIASWWAALPFFIDASVLDRAPSLRVIAGSFDTRYSRVLDV